MARRGWSSIQRADREPVYPGAPRVVDIDYVPRPHQLLIHQGLWRSGGGCVVCHRRFGKSVMAVNHLIHAVATCRDPLPRFAYMAPLYSMAKDIAWDYLKHYTKTIPGVKVNETELKVDFPGGGRVKLYGTDRPDTLRGLKLNGVWMDEYQMIAPRVWTEIVYPATTETQGWSVFSGTPQGRNHFYERYQAFKKDPGRFCALYPADETGVFSDDQLQEIQSQMPPDQYSQEYLCSWIVGMKGYYFSQMLEAAEREGRVGEVPWEPTLPVTTAWDLGVGDATAIWFVQQSGKEVRCIDYYEAEGEGIQHYARVLQEKRYTYSDHIAPHDIQVRDFSADGLARYEVAQRLGIRFRVATKLSVEERIEAARNLLPRCWFDAKKTKAGLSALSAYRRERDARTQELQNRPYHDWSTHGADAFGYLALMLRERKRERSIRMDTRWVV